MAQLHEIRLALVMNGGVSLAVWMGGVSHELDLIRRATTEGTPSPSGGDAPVAERWRTLMQGPGVADRRRLVIDVIAGTSAGGLNGTLLANAIAHDATLDPLPTGDDQDSEPARGPWLREQWCSLGSLRYGRLIPDPAENRPPTGSLLDGDFFYDQAHRLLTELTGGSEPSAKHPVTLFVTASGLGNQDFTAHDAAQQSFTVTDHRFLYRFTNDHVRGYDPATLTFTPPSQPGGDFDDVDRLALAARSSASFPVAFAPRREEGLNDPAVRQRPRRGTATPSWLMDGGVLDNAPFGPVLETVAAAPVSGHASRYVLYVVPSSGIGKGATAVDRADDQAPSWMQTAMSVVQFPREVDFRSDVEELEALRIEADTAWSDTQQAFDAACRDPGEQARLLDAAGNLQPIYTRGRAAGGVWEALTVARAGQITALDDTAAAPARDVAEILGTSPRWTPPIGAPVELFVPGPGTGIDPRWPWGMGPAERVVRTMLRAVRAQTAKAFRAGTSGTEVLDELEARLATLTEVRRNLRAIRRAVGVEVARLGEPSEALGDAPARPALIVPTSTPAVVANAINGVFDDLRVQEALGQQIQHVVESTPDGENLARIALAIEVVGRCTSSRMPDQRSAPFKFVRLGPDVPLPLLSPTDQERATRLGDRIIYGTQVGHFGSFGAESWRRWDWLMGRLHAVAHLGRLLHDTRTDDGRRDADAWVADTQRAVLEAEGISEEQLTATLQELEETFPTGPAINGLREMLKAMNDADQAQPAASTMQLADRLVHSSGGLPAGLGRWVKAAAARTAPAPDGDPVPARTGAVDRFVRWLAEPARATIWAALTAQRAPLDKSTGWPVLTFNPLVWIVTAVIGLGLLIAAAFSSQEWAWVLAAGGTFLATAGIAGTAAALILRRSRRAAATWIAGKLHH
ncbi:MULTISPECIES: DUF3376 domain-containing protein [unclassified Nocardioides]|uniref:DUF3376 domain-containing protein n=1 Tax=unclassified Nocardioides TaxID=2615069 RepID=UPI003614CE2E